MQYFLSYEVVIFSYNHLNLKAQFRCFLSGFVDWKTQRLQFGVILFISVLISTHSFSIFSWMVLVLGSQTTLKHICCSQDVTHEQQEHFSPSDVSTFWMS